MSYAMLKARARRYAREELGWPVAVAAEARPAGTGRACAVLVYAAEEPEALRDDPLRFVIAFDEWDRVVTDAGDPADFGWKEAPDEQ